MPALGTGTSLESHSNMRNWQNYIFFKVLSSSLANFFNRNFTFTFSAQSFGLSSGLLSDSPGEYQNCLNRSHPHPSALSGIPTHSIKCQSGSIRRSLEMMVHKERLNLHSWSYFGRTDEKGIFGLKNFIKFELNILNLNSIAYLNLI